MPRGIWNRPSDAEKLAARCSRNEATGCLECAGSTNRGYPKAQYKGRQIRANRAAWQIANGDIPAEEQVLHRCDNRRCVELTHLFVGTNRENMDDKIAKGRQLRGEAVAGAVLTAEQALTIYTDPRSQSQIAADYGVTRAAIGLIKQGRNWRHVTQDERLS